MASIYQMNPKDAHLIAVVILTFFNQQLGVTSL